MTTNDLVYRVYSQLVHDGEDAAGIYEPDIFAQVKPALIDLGYEIAYSMDGKENNFRNSYQVTLGNGFKEHQFLGSLNTAINDITHPLIIKLPFPAVSYNGNAVDLSAELGYIADPAVAIHVELANDVAIYTVEQLTQFTVYCNGDLNGESIQVLGNYIPTLSNITRPFESRLIQLVVERLVGGNKKKK